MRRTEDELECNQETKRRRRRRVEGAVWTGCAYRLRKDVPVRCVGRRRPAAGTEPPCEPVQMRVVVPGVMTTSGVQRRRRKGRRERDGVRGDRPVAASG